MLPSPAFWLEQNAIEAGYRVTGFDSVGSTNIEAIAAADRGDPGKHWFVAFQQTQGRGRRGRPWVSPYGNLAASLLVVPETETEHLASLGFVAGVALNTALQRILPQGRIASGLDGMDGTTEGKRARVALKWPNDVLADGAKLSGILLEVRQRPGGGTAVIVGIGVNVVAAPEGLPYPATSLRDLGLDLDAPSVFRALADNWAECYQTWDNGRGVAEIIRRWRQNAAGLGTDVVVQREKGVLRGVFEAIDDAGHMIVRDDEGHRVAVTAGDVHFGTTATLRE